jgi:hypothetical protein
MTSTTDTESLKEPDSKTIYGTSQLWRKLFQTSSVIFIGLETYVEPFTLVLTLFFIPNINIFTGGLPKNTFT